MAKLSFDRVEKFLAIVGVILFSAHAYAMAFPLSALKDMGGCFSISWNAWLIVVLYRCLIKR